MNIHKFPIIGFYIRSFSGLKKEVWWLSLIMFVNRCGLMVVPFLALYLAEILGWSKGRIGTTTFCFGLGALCGAYLGGRLADRFGPFRVMLISLFSGGIGFITLVWIKDFYLFSIGLFITSLFADLIRPAIFSSISVYSSKDNIARGISMVRLAFNAGISIGPAVGGFLAAHYGYHWLFVANGSSAILAGIILLYLGFIFTKINKGSSKKKDEAISSKSTSPYRDKWHLVFLGLNIIGLTCFFQFIFSVPTYYTEILELSKTDIGWFFTVNGLIIFIFEMPIIYYLEKRGLSLGPLVIGALMIGIAFMANVLTIYPLVAISVFALLIGFGEIINFPFISTISLKRATPENTGQYMGSVTVAFSAAFMLSPLVGLPIIEKTGYQAYWIGLALIGITAASVIYVIRNKFMEV